MPSLNELSTEISYRSTKDSRSGTDYSSAFGLRIGFDLPYSSSLLLRSNATRSYRSPAFYQAYQLDYEFSSFTFFGRDPCVSEGVEFANNPQRRAELCAQDVERRQDEGTLPGDFSYDPETFSEPSDGIPYTVSGNGNLRNEHGVSQNLGFTLIANELVHLSADFISIELKDLIDIDLGDGALSRCYDEGVLDDCKRIRRTNNFGLVPIQPSFQNIKNTSTKLVQANIYFPLPKPQFLSGKLEFNFHSQFLKEFILNGFEISNEFEYPKRLLHH